jgi:predicted Zn-dependent protease
MEKFRGIAVVGLALALGFGCATPPATVEKGKELEHLTLKQETKFGYYVDAAITTEFPVLKNEKVQGQVAKIGQEIVKNSTRTDLPFTFRVLNTTTVNAFAGPGGFVYVTVGLLDLLESKDELASVLAHEVGHVSARHSVYAWHNAQVAKNVLTLLDLAAMIGGVPAVAGVGGDIVADLGRTVGHLATVIVYQGYSRSYEEQADRLGINFMSGAGYKPEAAISVFEKFLELKEDKNSTIDLTILSSHPKLEDRIRNVKSVIKELKSSGTAHYE